MAKYSPKAQEKVEKTMHEFKKGELKRGTSAQKVKTSRYRAIEGPQSRR